MLPDIAKDYTAPARRQWLDAFSSLAAEGEAEGVAVRSHVARGRRREMRRHHRSIVFGLRFEKRAARGPRAVRIDAEAAVLVLRIAADDASDRRS